MYLIIAVMLIIAFLQIPELYKEKKYRELGAFLVMWVISGAYALVVDLDIPLVSPFELIVSMTEQFYRYFSF